MCYTFLYILYQIATCCTNCTLCDTKIQVQLFVPNNVLKKLVEKQNIEREKNTARLFSYLKSNHTNID